MTIDTINFSALSDKGRHNKYEDRGLCMGPNQVKSPLQGYLFAVADGLSGEKQASIAADLAIFYLKKIYFETLPFDEQCLTDHLETAVERANWEVYLQSVQDRDYEGMGSTLSAILFLDERAYIFHVGNSRIYRLGNSTEQLTQDHLDQRGLLTNFIGKGNDLEIFRTELPIEDGDQYLLCTDGLNLSPDEIQEIVKQNQNLKKANKDLVRLARKKGSKDDIASILLEIELA